MRHASLTALAGVLLAASSPASRALEVVIEPIGVDEGNVTALLERTGQYYVDAMRTLITERYKDEYQALRWEALESAMNRATVARLEYHFQRNGLHAIRVYHAMGGQPLGSLATSVFEGPTPPGTPTSPGVPLDPEASLVASDPIDYVAMDAADTAYFSGFDEVEVRAAVLPPEGSVLESFHIEETNTALHPEFKALRAIENDLKNGIVAPGGSIRGAIGGATCGSCRYAMRGFSKTYDVDIRISQMFGSLPRQEQRKLIESGRARLKGPLLVDANTDAPLLARDVLARSRESQVRQSLSPRAMGRSFKGMSWRKNSFRLGPIRLPRVSEGSSGGEATTPNPDVSETAPARC
jgi:hypothetical protein